MCGIVGYVNKNYREGLLLNDLIKSINYRGPDSKGKWWEEHQNNINEWHRELWLVICVNSWYIESKKD